MSGDAGSEIRFEAVYVVAQDRRGNQFALDCLCCAERLRREKIEGRGAGGLPRGRVCDLSGGVGELGPVHRDVDLESTGPDRVGALGVGSPGRRLVVGRRIYSGSGLEIEDRIRWAALTLGGRPSRRGSREKRASPCRPRGVRETNGTTYITGACRLTHTGSPISRCFLWLQPFPST